MHADELSSTLLVAGVFIAIALIEFSLGLYWSKKRFGRDWVIDLISLAQLALILKPAALFLSLTIASYAWPEGRGILSGLPFWAAFLIVFIPDDFMHYWYHRFAHQWDWMWPMHRTHHTPEQYQVTIAFRENWSWLFFMPGFWWMGLMIHLGLGDVVAVSALIIGLHNVVAHYGFTWDAKLYNWPVTGRLMRLLERVFNTPSLHRGHHGLGENGVPFGNYAQTLFIWDQLFGTAVFLNDKIPEKYGTIAADNSNWYQQLWWPFFSLPNTQDNQSDKAEQTTDVRVL
ncbi:MAG: sterol desaturase family protein [Marinicaulis sp.]|nr:sterol desaturase family protein [Marinicaulis sp.]